MYFLVMMILIQFGDFGYSKLSIQVLLITFITLLQKGNIDFFFKRKRRMF